MTDAEYREIGAKLQVLLKELSSTLETSDVRALEDLVEANELGLALESMIDAVAERGGRIPHRIRDEMLQLATQMEIAESVQARLAGVTEK